MSVQETLVGASSYICHDGRKDIDVVTYRRENNAQYRGLWKEINNRSRRSEKSTRGAEAMGRA